MPSLRSTLVSTGFFSLVLMLKLSIPVLAQFAATGIFPLLLPWLRPPYLYLVINCIIISIVASSKLQLQKDTQDDDTDPLSVPQDAVSSGRLEAEMVEEEAAGGGGEEVDTSTLVEMSNLVEGSRKLAKTVPNQGQTEEPEPESLESTWKAITEGGPGPLTKHLKKSDTWSSRVRRYATSSAASKMKKSETFAGDRSSRSETEDKANTVRVNLRGQPSLSQDELNRRVEAFIKRFNEEMRLQRQKSRKMCCN